MRDLSRQISLLAEVLAEPTEVFRELGREPGWIVGFVISGLVAVGMSILRAPFLHEAELQELARVLPEEALREGAPTSERMRVLECAILPFGLAARWTILSAALCLGLGLVGAHRVRFSSVFSVVAYSHTTLLAGELVNTLILYIKGVDAVRSSTDLDCMIGAGRILKDPSSQASLFAFLNSVNPFEAWHVVLLVIGLSVVTGIPRGRSLSLVATIVFLSAAGSAIAMSLVATAFGSR